MENEEKQVSSNYSFLDILNFFFLSFITTRDFIVNISSTREKTKGHLTEGSSFFLVVRKTLQANKRATAHKRKLLLFLQCSQKVVCMGKCQLELQ